MKKVTYKGVANRAVISEEDWDTAGVSSKAVEWNGYGDVQEVANEAADYLADHDARFDVDGRDDSLFRQTLDADPAAREADELRQLRAGTRPGSERAQAAEAHDRATRTSAGTTPSTSGASGTTSGKGSTSGG